jgi:glycosyltransferase involved in cell wall biosynthesis
MRFPVASGMRPRVRPADPFPFPSELSQRPDPIRVLHIAEAFGGGVFEQIRHLTERLPRHGVISAIAYGRRPETPPDPSRLLSPEVELFPLPWGVRTASRQANAAVALRRACTSWRPDVVHLHSSFAGIVGTFAVPRGLPIVYTPHGYSFTMTSVSPAARAAFRELERLVGARATVIGAVSHSEAAIARTIVPASKVRVVENGIPELDAVRDPEPRRTGRPRIVGMGRIVPQRCPQETAEILAGVADLAEVEWIGDGREPADRAPFERGGIPVSGWLPREEALVRLRQADIYLHGARWDGQPLSVLEAMAFGIVVVASDIAPLRDLVPSRRRYTSADRAVALIRSMLSDPAVLLACQAAQAPTRAEHGAALMAERWATLYGDVSRAGFAPSGLAQQEPVAVVG